MKTITPQDIKVNFAVTLRLNGKITKIINIDKIEKLFGNSVFLVAEKNRQVRRFCVKRRDIHLKILQRCLRELNKFLREMD